MIARLYSNENFPLPVVIALRELGHDVLTSLDAGKANQAIPDDEVLRVLGKIADIIGAEVVVTRSGYVLREPQPLPPDDGDGTPPPATRPQNKEESPP